MAIDEAIDFAGRRWPATTVARSTWGRPNSRVIFTATGKGRLWSADRPLGFWRNFAAIEVPDPAEMTTVVDPDVEQPVEVFVSRHGDPTGQMDLRAAAGQQIIGNTFTWPTLIAALKSVAAAWDDVDELGVSIMTGDKSRLEAADKALRRLLPTDPDGDREISGEIEVAYTVQGITLRPQTLRAFMVASAASARERAISMRQCAYCADWFELRRSDAFYCTPSCQATHHKRRATLQQQIDEYPRG